MLATGIFKLEIYKIWFARWKNHLRFRIYHPYENIETTLRYNGQECKKAETGIYYRTIRSAQNDTQVCTWNWLYSRAKPFFCQKQPSQKQNTYYHVPFRILSLWNCALHLQIELNGTVMTPYYSPAQEPFYWLKTFASVRPVSNQKRQSWSYLIPNVFGL